MMRPQDQPEACEQLISLFLTNATRPDFSLKLFYDDLQTNPDKLWKFCQDTFAHPPSGLLDWARAKAFIDAVESEPMLKLRHLGKRLGFKSESAFNEFAHRVFGATPQDAKRDTQRAKEKMRERYKAIQEYYEQMVQRASLRKPKLEQTKSTRRVLTKRNPETESRKRNFLEKRKEESKIGVIPEQ